MSIWNPTPAEVAAEEAASDAAEAAARLAPLVEAFEAELVALYQRDARIEMLSGLDYIEETLVQIDGAAAFLRRLAGEPKPAKREGA